MINRFYIACFRDNVGSSVSFHCKDFKGYHSNVDKAHVCTLEEAQNFYNDARDFELPLSADHVDTMTVWKVDHQHFTPDSAPVTEDCNAYVAYLDGRWDGNDLYWLNIESCSVSTDFSTASVLDSLAAGRLDPRYIIKPFEDADRAKRRTFDFNKVNRDVMVNGAGLKTPDHMKKAAAKVTSGKTRFNCPGCGKFSWQDNPNDFDSCKHCNRSGEHRFISQSNVVFKNEFTSWLSE